MAALALLLAFLQVQSILLRLYSTDQRQVAEGTLIQVPSLCDYQSITADFLLFLTHPCLQTSSDSIFLISKPALTQTEVRLVTVREKNFVRTWQGQWVWGVTLPETALLSDINATVVRVETSALPCSTQHHSEWNCILPFCSFPRLLSNNSSCTSNQTSSSCESFSLVSSGGITGIVFGAVRLVPT